MRNFKLFAALMIFALPAGFAYADPAPDPKLTDAEFTELMKMMDDAQDMLLGLITGLTDEQWNFKQNADRWSVAECTEHIVRSQALLLDAAKQAMAAPENPQWAEKTASKNEFIRKVMPNRNPGGVGGAQAPQEIQPTEHWDRARAFQEFYKIQGVCRAYMETVDREVKNHTFDHPFPVFGTLNAYDWLIYVPLHTVRHSKQIIEVQSDPNYPKKPAAAAGQ
jgi:hypothetical protein